ncbi:DUF302 domain-containing protein [Paracoccus sp. TK19116]|uniref:DUF302 domain-containing protein n=1 Tax=Paracoccus albicereus TaxID=2922394 RepID=A0ABT1MUX3_9RHOB|nr:DUF302 domain-containing protein [Paracoccus albicereus]MCQ0972147.1 DUF302 domain-containing protein [Paracoccus albicereus]
MRNARLAVFAALSLSAGASAAQEVVTQPFDGSFDDAAFAVESAITNQGLVVDHVSHVGEMLARTGADVGSDKELFTEADVFTFCSAVVSRQVMEADPMNIAYCPYGIFVAQMGDDVQIGYRTYPDGPMDAVETLLDTIVTEAVGG